MTITRVDPLLSQIIAENVRFAVNNFLTSCKSRRLSKDTITLYGLELEYFCQYLDTVGVEKIDELKPDTIRHYLLELSEHRNPGGCHVSFRVIKTFLRWTWEEFDLDTRCPIERVDAPRVNIQPLPGISLEDVSLMVDACKGTQDLRDRALLIGLLDTGCRASEFVALNIEDVNLLTGAVTIRHGKGDKGRTTFLGKTARKELRRYLKTRAVKQLFPTEPKGNFARSLTTLAALEAGLVQARSCQLPAIARTKRRIKPKPIFGLNVTVAGCKMNALSLRAFTCLS